MANTPDEQLVNMLKEDLQSDVQMCCPEDFMASGNGLENLKAMGVADAEGSAYKFKPLLSPTAERIERAKVEVPLNRAMLMSIAALGLVIYAAFFFLTERYLAKKNEELVAKQHELVTPANLKVGWDAVEKEISSRKADIEKIKAIKAGYEPIGSFVEKLIRTPNEPFVPEGLWFENLNLQQQDGKWSGATNGKVFFDDARKEREALDVFVYKLGRDPVVRKIFSSVELVSSSRVPVKEFEATSFDVMMRQK